MADFRYQVEKHLIIVPVTLYGPNGAMDADFILDTGAAHTIIDHSLVSALGYSASDATGHSKVRSVVGEERGYRVRIARIDALGKMIKNFEVACHDLLEQDVQGLLGMTFLEQFKFCIDPQNQTLSVE
jgi:predicted aspartyl protease